MNVVKDENNFNFAVPNNLSFPLLVNNYENRFLTKILPVVGGFDVLPSSSRKGDVVEM